MNDTDNTERVGVLERERRRIAALEGEPDPTLAEGRALLRRWKDGVEEDVPLPGDNQQEQA